MATNAQKIRTANLVMIVAGAAMVGILAIDRFGPQPTPPMSAKARNENIAKINREMHESHDKEKTEKDYLASRAWKEEVEQIGPKVLDQATAVAKAKGLTVTAFRPQRTVEDGNLVRVPFLVTLDGTYPQVASFLQTLEDSAAKVAVTMVQISSSDGVSDSVTATIGLMVLRDATKPPPEKAPAKAPAGAPKNDSGDTTNA